MELLQQVPQTKRSYLDSREDSYLPRSHSSWDIRANVGWAILAPCPGGPHSVSLPQVHWSGGNVRYHLESQPPGPFEVDTEGKLYVTRELDREAQAEVR